MIVLADANIHIRLSLKSDPLYQIASDAVSVIQARGDEFCLIPQILYEFWTVATRPATSRGGLDMNPNERDFAVAQMENLYRLFSDTPEVFVEWRKLVVQYQVSGLPAHDARIVAAMKVHGIGTILTFNRDDFVRYTDITVLTPKDVSATRTP